VMRTDNKIRSLSFVLLLLMSSTAVFAQRDEGRWLRVITGEYSIVDVDRTSLKVGNDSSLSALFRTTFTRSEDDPLKFNSGTVGLDTIEFSVRDKMYRVLETRSIDQSAAQPSSSKFETRGEWKSCWGRTCSTMYSAVKQLNPYGQWRVTGYRYANGQAGLQDDAEELKALKSSDVWFRVGSVKVRDETCEVSDFDGRTITEREWNSFFGSSLREFGFGLEQLSAVRFACKPSNGVAQWNFILRLDQERAILLWEGVFLELKRVPTPFIL
jgi:hypothetical protein